MWRADHRQTSARPSARHSLPLAQGFSKVCARSRMTTSGVLRRGMYYIYLCGSPLGPWALLWPRAGWLRSAFVRIKLSLFFSLPFMLLPKIMGHQMKCSYRYITHNAYSLPSHSAVIKLWWFYGDSHISQGVKYEWACWLSEYQEAKRRPSPTISH